MYNIFYICAFLKLIMGHFGIGSPVFLSLLRPTEKRMHENGLKERIQSNPICSYSDFSKFFKSQLLQPKHKIVCFFP